KIESPLFSKAILMEARALASSSKASQAVALLRANYGELPQPDTDLALADAYQAANDLPNAAASYQQVYFRYPSSSAAATAGAALAALRDLLGASYPPAMPTQMLDRANRLLDARDYTRAKSEFQTLIPQLAGLERDQARVRVGAADYLANKTEAAYRYLSSLTLEPSEADAERMYYAAECARRMSNEDEMTATLNRMGILYPASPWRLKALVSAGNSFFIHNQPDKYEPLFEAGYRAFPKDPAAAYCHWRVAWSAYLRRKSGAGDLLREHVARYASQPTAASALYFLGRMAEKDGDYGAARACYSRLLETYPNYYYGILARQRLSNPKIGAAAVPGKVSLWLEEADLPRKSPAVDTKPAPLTTLRIERARLLRFAGFADWAASELRFGARKDGQPYLLAVELARSAGSAHDGIRYMKALAPGYLSLSLDGAPRAVWELLFPLPYKSDLLRYARQYDLDPYLVAGLIRQESEFDPQALSRANAHGLTQVMPATGRQLARKVGVRRFSSKLLFQPATNLKFGTYYLHTLLDQWEGKWPETLASYNAGKSRVSEWVNWSDYKDQDEFVESIPFSETRNYVQSVLRNAEIYRSLYKAKAAPKPAPRKKVAGSKNHRGPRS
ncbi:MAG: transglycosylase SLT domain-containing protein, partial [Acidobacteria bacterium]|nr:transglycosylase SLT domain-containing protein [Acidobacteriota bacterium]